MIGPLVSAGASIVGGLFNRQASKDAAHAQRVAADRQIQMQKDFAQQGIRWRVDDAKAAGIHPLYALGAQTPSYTPTTQTFAADNSFGNAMASAGQDIGRAINSTRTAPERADAYTKAVQSLTLQNAGLDTEIKRAQLASILAKQRDNATPPSPGVPFEHLEDKPEKTQPLMWMGHRVATPRDTSPAKAVEDNLGDDIFSPGFLWNLPAYIRENVKDLTFGQIIKAIDKHTAIPWPPTGRR